MIVWQYDSMIVWWYDSMTVWQYDSMTVQFQSCIIFKRYESVYMYVLESSGHNCLHLTFNET